MEEKRKKRKPRPSLVKSWGTELPAVAATDEALVDALEAVTRKLGFVEVRDYEQVPTWLGPLVMENGEMTERGRNRARCVVKFLGTMLNGGTVKQSLAEAGMTRAQLTAFRYACPALDTVYREVKAALKETIGDSVLEAAYDAAVNGLEVYDGMGNMCGYRKSEKMLDKLLALAGKEFRRDDSSGGGGSGDHANVKVELHFDRKGISSSATVEAVDV